ncbi:MAG: phospholipase D-like domain-containing protein [Gaiellaceae bacterium]|jgi:phosphatidylserine/phosphatidylglycerophosphate/cardiolipin synthase-like enzyme
MIQVTLLRDGGQSEASVADKVASFLSAAKQTLELALYDVHLESEQAAPIKVALDEALARQVRVRLVYNVDFGKAIAVPRPPISRPELVEALPVEARAVPGVPDLMHHKYVIRDGDTVLTGSTNWTDESWTREENLIAFVASKTLAARYQQNFEELWEKRDVASSGHVDSAPIEIDGHRVRPWFAPGHGEALAHRIARCLGQAKRRIRIASPVLTSGPILGTLAELSADHDRSLPDIAGVLDATQIAEVIGQWRARPNVSWKEAALRAVIEQRPWSGKKSTPWTPDSVHDYMHAKTVVADNTVFFGSFNLSRSGESNAENTLEIDDAGLADELASFVDDIRGRYPRLEIPAPRGESPGRAGNRA